MKVEDLKIIRLEINNALKSVAESYDLKIDIGSITYDTTDNEVTKFWGKMTCESENHVDSTFIYMMKEYLEIDDINKIFEFMGKKIKFIAYKTKARKMPFIYEDVATKKKYKCSIDQAKRMVKTS